MEKVCNRKRWARVMKEPRSCVGRRLAEDCGPALSPTLPGVSANAEVDRNFPLVQQQTMSTLWPLKLSLLIVLRLEMTAGRLTVGDVRFVGLRACGSCSWLCDQIFTAVETAKMSTASSSGGPVGSDACKLRGCRMATTSSTKASQQRSPPSSPLLPLCDTGAARTLRLLKVETRLIAGRCGVVKPEDKSCH